MAVPTQPVLILKEGAEYKRDEEARNMNFMAAKAVAAAVRTTLGPRGMDKMLVDPAGLVTITNDGATILDELSIKHPAAKMIVEVAKTQDDEVGDGTTTAAVLTGAFIEQAEDLIGQGIHPTTIVSGYQKAAKKAREILEGIALDADDRILTKIAETAMTGKGVEFSRGKLADVVVSAVKSVVKEEKGKKKVDIKDISIEKRSQGSVEDTELIHGIIMDKIRTHQSMPEKIVNAKILLLTAPIEIREAEIKSEISMDTAEQTRSFFDHDEKILKGMVSKVAQSGANVVFCQKGVDDLARYYLAKAGVFVAHRVKKNDLHKLEKATGAKIVSNLEDIAPSVLGSAGVVEEKMVGNGEMIFIGECKNPVTVSILLRGGTEHVVTSLDRAMHDALRVVGVTIEDGKVVAGGGAPEVETALRLREYASTLEGREQLAVMKFAQALEIIPKTLAENAGLDSINMLAELRSRHEAGEKTVGLNVLKGVTEDMWETGVVEPLRVKTQAIASATEAASMILRIDDVISAKQEVNAKKRPEDMKLDE